MILNASNRLRCLSLDGNNIGSRDTTKILTQFLLKSELKVVYLRENDFGDETAEFFASALRCNAHLRVIDLSNNQLSQLGRRTIHNALFYTSSLNAAFGSNHTCVAYIDEPELKDKLSVINCKGSPEENQQRKYFPPSMQLLMERDCVSY